MRVAHTTGTENLTAGKVMAAAVVVVGIALAGAMLLISTR